jgi:hypothetical protein
MADKEGENKQIFQEEIDIQKIRDIKKIESRIVRNELKPKIISTENNISFVSNNNNNSELNNLESFNKNSNIPQQNLESGKEKLLKHANFYHNFSEYNTNVSDVIPLFFKKESYAQDNGLENQK